MTAAAIIREAIRLKARLDHKRQFSRRDVVDRFGTLRGRYVSLGNAAEAFERFMAKHAWKGCPFEREIRAAVGGHA